MVNVTINGVPVLAKEGSTVLETAKSAGIFIPTLCFLKDINEIGACRVCAVEVKGLDRLVSACNTPVTEGMEIFTDSDKAVSARKTNVELILSEHDFDCDSCVRKGNCNLSALAESLGLKGKTFNKNLKEDKFPKDFPLVKDENKCIKCMRCVSVCEKVQNLGVWDVINTGSRTAVAVGNPKGIKNADCVLCGQCITHCPTGALKERDDTLKVIRAIEDKNKITVFQIAPAVRAAWGESFGLNPSFATVKRLCTALKKIGADYVFDTNFAADLTIMEEGNEFIERLADIKKTGLPMFTSCCPGWVRFVKAKYPEFVDRLSTAKSPQQMFGALAKTYYADILGVSPDKIFSVSVMPCISKKHEGGLDVMKSTNAGSDIDAVLTTREADRLISACGIIPDKLEETELDAPLGVGTGAAVVFGTTGGVMDAALRSAYKFVTGTNPNANAFYAVRGVKGWKEAKFDVGDITVSVAVAHGLKNASDLLDAIKNKEVRYDFVEIMACPGGCVGGGGQPIKDGEELFAVRGEALKEIDENSAIRYSHENPAVINCYEKYLGKPLSEKAHKLLHTDHHAWKMPNE